MCSFANAGWENINCHSLEGDERVYLMHNVMLVQNRGQQNLWSTGSEPQGSMYFTPQTSVTRQTTEDCFSGILFLGCYQTVSNETGPQSAGDCCMITKIICSSTVRKYRLVLSEIIDKAMHWQLHRHSSYGRLLKGPASRAIKEALCCLCGADVSVMGGGYGLKQGPLHLLCELDC